MRSRVGAVGLVAAQLVAFWPVMRWYALRMTDGSDGPWGVVALATAIVCAFSRRCRRGEPRLLVPTMLVLFYVATYHLLPPLLRGAVATICLACTLSTLSFGRTFDPGLCGLMLLALPVIASMQFYLGYPLRVAVGAVAAGLLSFPGLEVVREGATLTWAGQVIAIDAPCSGVKMLWAGFYFAFTFVAFLGLNSKQTARICLFTAVCLMAGNVMRTASLFCLEAGLVAMPAWCHPGVGVLVFAAACSAIVWFARRVKPCGSCLHT